VSWRRALPLVLVVLAAAPARADDAPVVVRAHVEPDTTTIGARVRYTVEVESAPGTEVLVTQPSERLGDFDIVDFGIAPAVERDGRTVVTRWYTLVGYSPGHHLVKSPPVQYRLPGETLAEAPGVETRISLDSVLAASPEATDIRDIKAPEPVPVDRRPYYLLGGGAALLLLLAAVLYRVMNRPRGALAAPPPRPAHEVAAAALEALRRQKLVESGAFKEFYSTLSAIVRTYLEQRFGLRAPEMTTEEFLLASARDGRLRGAHRRLLGEFLTESDMVKFARHLPAPADTERAWGAAKRFIDETAAREALGREEQRAAG
jgi:hypothetical protein